MWAVDGATWSHVNADGFGSTANTEIQSLVAYAGLLFATMRNNTEGTGVWSYDGTTWTQVNTAGFGDSMNHEAREMAVFDDLRYVGTYHSFGAEVSDLARVSHKDSRIWVCLAK